MLNELLFLKWLQIVNLVKSEPLPLLDCHLDTVLCEGRAFIGVYFSVFSFCVQEGCSDFICSA